MSEETTTPEGEGTTATPEATPPEDQSVPYERFAQVNKKAKEAADRAKQLQKQMAELQAQMEERENAGLPELERERKRAEQLEKRAAEAEQRAEQMAADNMRKDRRSWVIAAATEAKFIYPNVAASLEDIDLDDINSQADAARAIAKVAKAYPDLVRKDDPQLPGRVLENGQQPKDQPKDAAQNMSAEAQFVSEALAQFRKSRDAA